MLRRYTGHKEPCKNLGLVVKNSVKIALPLEELRTHGSVYCYLRSCRDTESEAKSVFSSVFDTLQKKLGDKTFSIPELWGHLVDIGVNPIDLIFPKISKTHIWSIGGISFVPNFSSQTEGNPGFPPFDPSNAATNGKSCDILIKKVLSLPTIAYKTDCTADFQDSRARIFSAFLTANNPISVCAYSPELTACFDSWVDELATMDDEYKIMGVSWILHSLKDLPGVSSISHPCPPEFHGPALAIVSRVLSKISEVRIDRNVKDPHDSTELNRYGVVFDYLDTPKEDRLKLCTRVAQIGNDAVTISVFDGLIRSPKNYTQACVNIGLSGESALEYLGQNLARVAWFNSTAYSDVAKVTQLVNAFRAEFSAVGYPDPAGTVAFDFLAQSLATAEHFEKLGFIRREPLSRPSMFLRHFEGEAHDKATPDDVVLRKVDMAIKLNQRDLLKNEIDLFFKGHKHQSKNSDFGGEKAIRYLLESGYFDASEILINDNRRAKVMSMGVSGKAILPAAGASRRIKAMAIEHDLGI